MDPLGWSFPSSTQHCAAPTAFTINLDLWKKICSTFPSSRILQGLSSWKILIELKSCISIILLLHIFSASEANFKFPSRGKLFLRSHSNERQFSRSWRSGHFCGALTLDRTTLARKTIPSLSALWVPNFQQPLFAITQSALSSFYFDLSVCRVGSSWWGDQ